MKFSAVFILLFSFLIYPHICQSGNLRTTEILSAQNIRIEGNNHEDISIVVQIVRVTSQEVDNFLGIDTSTTPPRPEITVLIDAENDADIQQFSQGILTVSTMDYYVHTIYNLIRIQLIRHARQLTGRTTWQPIPSINWMAAAICNRIVFGGKGIRWNYRPNYSRQLRMYRQNIFPDLTNMLNMMPPDSEQSFFLLYLLHCDALALCFSDVNPTTDDFKQMFLMEYNGRTGSESVQFVCQKLMTPDENLQTWFQRTALTKCRVGDSKTTSDDIKYRLDNLMRLPVSDVQGLQFIPIREIPTKFKDYKIDAMALTILQSNLMELAHSAPLLLRPPIEQFSFAIESLKQGKKNDFISKYDYASRQFDLAIQQIKKINKTLDNMENANATIPPHIMEKIRIFDKNNRCKYPLKWND